MWSINKKAEIVWDKLGKWILLLVLLVLLLLLVYSQKENMAKIVESIKIVFRFGG